MATTLFFYDLETSGIYPDSGRIMQFAGQRTDLNLKEVGQPINQLIRLNEDILPDPAAVLVHGISPQQTIEEGLSEAEFLKLFYSEATLPDTTFVGFNNIRFDDEFMRYLNYRNLYDPYAWSYENNASRWDMLDVVRLTRALRPDGINWPIDDKGANVNRLEMLTKANKLDHANAHDALADVRATIAIARLIKEKQPKLYSYLFNLRLKSEAAKLAASGQPFIYTSSHYPSSQLHTTIVKKVADHPDKNCIMVFDLRIDPSPWQDKSPEQLADSWRYVKDRDVEDPPLPVKTMRLNRCPAIAPLTVMDKDARARLELDMEQVEYHEQQLDSRLEEFARKLNQAVGILNTEQAARQKAGANFIDSRLYDGFYSDSDRRLLKELHQHEAAETVRRLRPQFADKRLNSLCSFYLARNYKQDLTDDERKGWDDYVNKRLFSGGDNSRLMAYFNRIQQLAKERQDKRSQLLLEDLRLYGESLIPSELSA